MAGEMNVSPIPGERREHVARLSSKDYHKPMIEKFGDRYLRYRSDWERSGKGEYLPPFPVNLDIEPVDLCNLKCIMCPRSTDRGSGARLSFEAFKRIVDEGEKNGLSAIQFGSGCEPLLSKDLLNMIDHASSRGIMDIRLGTNGVLLKPELSQELVASGLTYITISIDAASARTYRAIRGGDLRKVEDNIKAMLDIRARSGRSLPIVRVSFVAMPENMQELDDFVSKWSPLVDFLDIQDYIRLDYIQREEPNVVIDSKDFPEGYACFQPWQRVSITAHGDVNPCCTFHGRELVIGNIHKHSIAKCWNSQRMKQIRKQLSANNLPPQCQYCYASRQILYQLPN